MSKHKAVFYGRIEKRRYKFGVDFWTSKRDVYELFETEYRQITECEFERPPLQLHDEIHIEEIDEIVRVERVVRSTDDSFRYYTKYVIETIEDEETEKTKRIAEDEKKEWEEKQSKKELNNNIADNKSNKKWYQFWK